MENDKHVVGKNLCVRINRYHYIVFEDGSVGIIIYFKRVILQKQVGKRLFETLVDSMILTDWDKITKEKIGAGSFINISIKYTSPYVVYDYVRVGTPPGTVIIKAPDTCPLCKCKIEANEKSNKKVKCRSEHCDRFEITRIARFLKFCLGIHKFPYLTVYFFYINKLITSITDLYKYTLPENIIDVRRIENRFLQEAIMLLSNNLIIPRPLMYYALMPKLTPNLIWRYSSTEIISWINIPNFPYSYNGVELRKDRTDSIEKCASEFLTYKINHKEELALLNNKITVTHNVNPEIADKTFYLMPYKYIVKEYLIERIRLYGGRVDRNPHDLNRPENMKGIDIIVTEAPEELERVFKNDTILIRSYQWLKQQIELRV